MKAHLSLIIISLLLCFAVIVGCGGSSVQVSDNSTPTETPIPYDEFTWPDNWPIPKPESDKGEVENDSSKSLFVIVGYTSKKQYEKYVSKCRDAGFDVDYDKLDNDYFAYNADGYWLHISYMPGSVMYISVRVPGFGED